MPPSRLSPDFRARTNIARICCFGDAGKPDCTCIVIVAQPSAPVGVSAGIENCWNGTAVAYTSALATERPLQAVTWKRTVRSVVDRVITDGVACWPSMSNRAGGETVDTSTGPVPAGQPFTTGGTGAVFGLTTAVSFEVACEDPSAFFAVTRTRSVSPTSAARTRYDELSAPPMLEQPLPWVLQRRHWYA